MKLPNIAAQMQSQSKSMGEANFFCCEHTTTPRCETAQGSRVNGYDARALLDQ